MSQKPLLKWLGGKTQLLHQLFEQFPTTVRNYVEPFVGGGSVLLEVCARIQSGEMTCSGEIIASDINPILIHFYVCVQQHPNELWDELQILQREYISCTGDAVNRRPDTKEEALQSKENYYYYTRSLFNREPLGTVKKSAYFLFLNKTCFRGVYREGPNGFNVPFGNYDTGCGIEREHLVSVSACIQRVHFVCQSFTTLFTRGWSRQDFIYFDPPYVPEDSKSFTDYTVDGFKEEQHLLLFDWCKNLKTARVPFLLSNSDTELVRTHFPTSVFTVIEVGAKRSIHSKRPQSRTTELLIY